MPFESLAQEVFAHEHPEKFGGKAVVEEFDKATKGKKLPKRTGKRNQPGPGGRSPKRDRNRSNTAARKEARRKVQDAREAANRLALESAPETIQRGTRTMQRKWLAENR